jgi:hypothetical protein
MSDKIRGSTVNFHDVEVRKQTDKALLCYFHEFEEEYWIPQSQIHDDSEVWKAGQRGTIVISEWIATQKGLM